MSKQVWVRLLILILWTIVIVFPLYFSCEIVSRVGIMRKRSLIEVTWRDWGLPFGVLSLILAIVSSGTFLLFQFIIIKEVGEATGLPTALLPSAFAAFAYFSVVTGNFRWTWLGTFLGGVFGGCFASTFLQNPSAVYEAARNATSQWAGYRTTPFDDTTFFLEDQLACERQDETMLILCSAFSPWLLFYQASLVNRRGMRTTKDLDNVRLETFYGIISVRSFFILLFISYSIAGAVGLLEKYRYILVLLFVCNTLVGVMASATTVGWCCEEAIDMMKGLDQTEGLLYDRTLRKGIRPCRALAVAVIILLCGWRTLSRGGSQAQLMVSTNALNTFLMGPCLFMLLLYTIFRLPAQQRFGISEGTIGGPSLGLAAFTLAAAACVSLYFGLTQDCTDDCDDFNLFSPDCEEVRAARKKQYRWAGREFLFFAGILMMVLQCVAWKMNTDRDGPKALSQDPDTGVFQDSNAEETQDSASDVSANQAKISRKSESI